MARGEARRAGLQLGVAELLAHQRGALEGVVLTAGEHLPGDRGDLARATYAELYPLLKAWLGGGLASAAGGLRESVGLAAPTVLVDLQLLLGLLAQGLRGLGGVGARRR